MTQPIATSYVDAWKQRRRVARETVDAVRRIVEAPNGSATDMVCEPVAVAWDDAEPALTVTVPETASDDEAVVSLILEDRSEQTHLVELSTLRPQAKKDGIVTLSVPLPDDLPLGYVDLRVQVGARSSTGMLVRAPVRAHGWDSKRWGVFAPVYALRSGRSCGVGDLGDLLTLLRWVADLGGSLVATLPLLATFLDDPFEPSPYSPVSRLHWNEALVDIDPIAERSTHARAIVASPGFREEVATLDASRQVDWAAVARLKRRVLEAACDEIAAEPDDYARFRGLLAAQGPDPKADGAIDERAMAYHACVQAIAREQLDVIARERAALVFDLPLGVHPFGYDAWRFRDAFAEGVSGGAPPDNFFTKGQNWSFRPLHPIRIREQRYAYPIACLRNLLRYARVLRIDHVMGLQRLWWIPEGAAADEGTYVRYNAEELYAIVCLESHRAGAVIVGEDLGTVPRETRRAMVRHGLQRTFAAQEEIDIEKGLRAPPEGSLATLNTHDMPPFAAWWEGRDIATRVEIGLLDDHQGKAERTQRMHVKAALSRSVGIDPSAAPREALRACLGRLARSKARAVVVALEDLWSETEPQNTPGTGPERPNWRRKGKKSLEQLFGDGDIETLLRTLTATRGAQ